MKVIGIDLEERLELGLAPRRLSRNTSFSPFHEFKTQLSSESALIPNR
jgi:hypothetical protein